MKTAARSYFWYPGLDQEIEHKAQSCTSCQAVKNAPPAEPIHPWLWPTKPWQRICWTFQWQNILPGDGCTF